MIENLEKDGVIVVSNNYVTGYKITKTIGFTWGLTVRSRGFFPAMIAFLRMFFGGEIKEFTDMLNYSREKALERLVAHAKERGANAIISARFDSSQLGTTMSEILAYGTAVVIEKDETVSQPVRLS